MPRIRFEVQNKVQNFIFWRQVLDDNESLGVLNVGDKEATFEAMGFVQVKLNVPIYIYRTQVSLGSDLWVRFSVTNSLRHLVADLTYLMKILTQY